MGQANTKTKMDEPAPLPPIPTEKDDYDHLFKLMINGDKGVGKSFLVLRYADNTFSPYITTIGVDFKIKTIIIDGQRIKLHISDTWESRESFRTLTPSYFRGTHGMVVVYDVTSGESFDRGQRKIPKNKKSQEAMAARNHRPKLPRGSPKNPGGEQV